MLWILRAEISRAKILPLQLCSLVDLKIVDNFPFNYTSRCNFRESAIYKSAYIVRVCFCLCNTSTWQGFLPFYVRKRRVHTVQYSTVELQMSAL